LLHGRNLAEPDINTTFAIVLGSENEPFVLTEPLLEASIAAGCQLCFHVQEAISKYSTFNVASLTTFDSRGAQHPEVRQPDSWKLLCIGRDKMDLIKGVEDEGADNIDVSLVHTRSGSWTSDIPVRRLVPAKSEERCNLVIRWTICH